jgi:hypothetical protein
MMAALSCFAEVAKGILLGIFARYNVDVADGSIDSFTGKPKKNKLEVAEPGADMENLGVRLSLHGDGSRGLVQERAAFYAASGRALAANKYCDKSAMEKFLGRTSFASQALCGVGPAFRQVLGELDKAWGRQGARVHLSFAARQAIDLLCDRIAANKGMALWPMDTPLGSHDRGITWTFSDASFKKDAKPEAFHGYGGWCWLVGTDSVFYISGRWSLKEMAAYDNTALEYFASSLIGESVTELHRALALLRGRDIVAVGDNSAASRDVGQSGKAYAPKMRRLVARRAANPRLDRLDREVHVHVRREFNEEADRLSTGKVAQFKDLINRRFGREMTFQRLPHLPFMSRQLAVGDG